MTTTQDRTALVTGGMGGLGEAIARALYDAGCRVLVTHARDAASAAEWLAGEADKGYRFHSYDANVADFESCKRMAERIRADGLHVDILVNNAGITRDATFRKLEKDGWDAVLRTNLDSVFNVTKPFIDGMVERGWGRVINISSINGSKGQFGQTNYSAAKAGIHGFTKALAQEVARKGVTVNTVSPGYLATKMVTAVPEDTLKQIVAGIPVGRLGQPDEIAALVAFIASDAAGFMTGSNVAMNGGQHMY
ncbi:acetoacetyl-CoA reductase [Burkholderia multivorans]|uniref:Acetoacetyl-CoA reductase n=2 Tax=Burkholderia cepacia complex TaxID=87882 RepID=A4JS22_BURVG|nr:MULTISPECIES: acetoacetyl-CoA reductase [Burkholderia cepacia complex]ABO59075.1 acetoacetyl-CoA reductase [Burkholderia vietnamiensis G4]AOK02180.1 beta-ketoacyl-ACP reductase [Burkholderia vietnamiensis]AOK44672.1 beta-ketoacyl-ACP reductase [Burkholderia vietnamiensis]KVR84609.1 beta-ketoacyl-ACP reductase [Burkholderia vietnamiensis]KVS12197.1 beta-ketoacyl-ACP reductase [Burkholderia vietnamiensis]